MGISVSEGGVYTGNIPEIIKEINDETFVCPEGKESYQQALEFLRMARISGMSDFELALSNSTCVENHAGVVFVLNGKPTHSREASTLSFLVDRYFEKNIHITYERVLLSEREKRFMERIEERRFIKEVKIMAKRGKVNYGIYKISNNLGMTDKQFNGLRICKDLPKNFSLRPYAITIGMIDDFISSYYIR